ncbi:transcriptional protein SWT1-like [Daphnia carinata]|uniref:transcriptional protein SWT1-like n=1 Tax=Daphnia carinata TaxID=120202 RepID=UPI00257A805C|nr:transcriptional protein SWT1-like [Daphnia carinata]
MGKEKKSSNANLPQMKHNSIVQKKRKMKTSVILVNNNTTKSDGIRNLVASTSGARSPKLQHDIITCTQEGQPSKSCKNHRLQEAHKILNKKLSLSSSEDVMEWEPTEKEVMETLFELRKDFSARTSHSSTENSTRRSEPNSNIAAYIVIDTNIFLSHLPIVKTLTEDEEFSSKVQILVPWMVLQELDFMKSNRQNKINLEIVARKAATLILEQINKKNSFFRSQTLTEFKSCINLLPYENADDKILQWCLYLKNEMLSDIILLSNDVLFCAKASANGIQPMQSANFIPILRQMLLAETACGSGQGTLTNFVKNTPNHSEDSSDETPGRPSNHQQDPCRKNEVVNATSFLYQFEECIVDSMSQLLEYEMKQVYEDIWHQIVLIKPPWNFRDLLRCIDKHWIAVFGYIYPKDMQQKLNHLSNMWKNIKTKVTVQQEEREMILQSAICILQLVQRTRNQFRYALQKAIDGLQRLLQQDAELNDTFILDLFTRVWGRFNFICGTLSDAVGVAHPELQYEPDSTCPTLQEVRDGLQKLKPLLLGMEGAMSSFLQNSETSPVCRLRQDRSLQNVSRCILLSIRELGLQVKETATAESSLSRTMVHFASNAQHRKKMEIGLEQLRVYIRVLDSVASKLH